MQGAFYRAYHLHVHSEVPLPGARPDAEERSPDLRIVLSDEEDASPAVASSGPYRLLVDGSLVLEAPSIGRLICSERGSLLRVRQAAGAADSELAELLIATGLPMALWMRGHIVLHAAAAVLAGQRHAVALAGHSGSGKSSLVRELLLQGGRIVGDDTLCVRESSSPMSTYEVSGLSACTFLRVPDEAKTAPRGIVPVPPDRQLGTAPLGQILVLDPAAPSSATPRRLRGVEAFQALLQNLHRPRVPRLLGAAPVLLPCLAALSSAVGIYLWNPIGAEGIPLLPRNFDWMPK
jgi:hypothetical protein